MAPSDLFPSLLSVSNEIPVHCKKEGKVSPAPETHLSLGRKISHYTFRLHPAISLTNDSAALTLSFLRKICYFTPCFLTQLWFVFNCQFHCRDMGLHIKQWEAIIAQCIVSFAQSCNQHSSKATRRQPVKSTSPLHPLPNMGLPRPLSHTGVLSPLIWTVAVRDEDSPFTLWASQEKTALWLIPGDRPRKEKQRNTNGYIILLQPPAEFQLCLTSNSYHTCNWTWTGCKWIFFVCN